MTRFLFCCALALAVACATTQTDEKKPYSFQPANCNGIEALFQTELSAYADKVDEATKNYEIEQWKVETADPAADPKAMSARFVDLQKVLYDKDVLAHTIAMDEATAALPPSSCPFKQRLKRARGMLETSILTDAAVIQKEKENQDLQDAMIAKSNAFRMNLPGEKEPVSRAIYQKKLGSIADRKQREALYHQFQSARADEWLKWGFKELLRARNAEAKLAGYPNYYEYRFYRNQLDLKNYLAMVAQVKTELAPKVRKALQAMVKRAHIGKVQGWDLHWLREREAFGQVNPLLAKSSAETPLEIARQFYSGLGISIDDYHFLMDLFPRAGKNTHAFAMPVVFPHVDDKGAVLAEPKPDIRFLANLKQPVKWEDASTVIHELGHAVHAAEVRQPIGLFRGIGSVETEAIAMTMERMAGSEEFLEAVLPGITGVSVKKLRPLLKKQVAGTRTEQAFMLLRQVFFTDFEYEMYKNPDADFGMLWSKMQKDYWNIEIEPKEADWDVEHYVMAPVYIENYSIGILMVEQLYQSMVKEFHTSYHSKDLGDKLKNTYFAPGEEFDYLELTRSFSGAPLTATAALGLID